LAAYRTLILALLGLLWLQSSNAAVSEALCGSLRGTHYGPYDYRPANYKPDVNRLSHAERRALVEDYHFTPRVENLIGAQSGERVGPPGKDLSYTLRAFPNNHRALVSVMRYGEKFKTESPPGLQYPVECYFERAIRFAPDDVISRILYSTYLKKYNRTAEAAEQLRISTDLAKDSPFSHYNIGLAYFELKDYSAALQSAWRAKELGFDRIDLSEKLKAVGQWREPPEAVEPPTSPAADAASAAASSPELVEK